MPEWMITSTICRDEPKFYMDLVNFDIVVHMTHSVNAINIKENDNLVLEPTYHTLYTCSWLYPYLCLYLHSKLCKRVYLDTYITYGIHAKV